MRKLTFSVILLVFSSVQLFSQQTGTEPGKKDIVPRQISDGPKNDPNVAPKQADDPVQTKTDQIVKKLSLDEQKAKAVYNVMAQIDKRMNDLALGTDNYAKLLGYIHEERGEMLKAALTPEQYLNYQKNFGNKDRSEVNKMMSKNEAFVRKRDAAALKEKRESETIMARDKSKQAAAEKKAKEQAKKEADKQAAADKKAADKQKQLDKKLKDKQKAAEKKEKDRQAAADKKAKEQAKRDAARQKALEKKLK